MSFERAANRLWPGRHRLRRYRDDVSPGWAEVLRHNQLDTFEAIWNLKAPWYEPLNVRRGGWSGVSRINCKLPGGDEVGVFIKRQSNHRTRHPLLPEATIAREWRCLKRCEAHQIPCPRPLYFAERLLDGNLEAVLMTEELEGFEPLDQFIERWQEQGWPSWETRKKLLDQLAGSIARMHRHFILHGSFHARHVLVSQRPTSKAQNAPVFDVRFIDFEKAMVFPIRTRSIIRDLDQLNRHVRLLSLRDRLYFFRRYSRGLRLAPWIRKRIISRSGEKILTDLVTTEGRQRWIPGRFLGADVMFGQPREP